MRTYICSICDKEEVWTKNDTVHYSNEEDCMVQDTYPDFYECPYCEDWMCEDCKEKHVC